MPKLSVIVPVYNEAQTIETVIEGLSNLDLDKEIIVVDDASNDGSSEKIKKFCLPEFKLLKHDFNRGKGMALRTGIAKAEGEFIVFCDADLEYNVSQIPMMLDFLLKNNLTVVYGSRFINYQPRKNLVHYLGNYFLTWLTNLLFGSKLTDMETAYKMFRADVLKSIKLEGQRFEIEPEITAKILKKSIKITEVPISYDPRTKTEGKKIKYRDGLAALRVLLKEKLEKDG
jgi:glycosyltransferase involved in cell wall biosynthesis